MLQSEIVGEDEVSKAIEKLNKAIEKFVSD